MAPGSRTRVACPLCGAADLARTLELSDRWLLTCNRCGVRCTDRYGDEPSLRSYYGNVLAHHGKAEALDGQEGSLEAIAREQADSMERLLGPRRGGTFLEIGCARGQLLAEMETRGWEVSGMDLSDTAIEQARTRTKAVLHAGSAADAPFAEASFDRIGMFDVLAHLPEPLEFLKVAASWLKPGGHLVLSTVNEAWSLAQPLIRACRLLPGPLRGIRDEMYEGQHYCYFSSDNVSRLLSEVGLQFVEVRPLEPLSTRFFVHQYGLRRRMLLLSMVQLDRWLGSSRKMLVVAQKAGG